jgi:isocitrate lyase
MLRADEYPALSVDIRISAGDAPLHTLLGFMYITCPFNIPDLIVHPQSSHHSKITYQYQLLLVIMSKAIVNTTPYPFQFKAPTLEKSGKPGEIEHVTGTLKNVRGKIPSVQVSALRTMMLEAHNDPTKILAHCCSYDGLSSRLVEEAGFPMIFLAGYSVSSAYGLPDTGYIAMAEMCDKIQETVRQVSVPVMADGDTGYGSPLNVKRTVESYAHAGAAGIMIEDQTWPKRKSLDIPSMLPG